MCTDGGQQRVRILTIHPVSPLQSGEGTTRVLFLRGDYPHKQVLRANSQGASAQGPGARRLPPVGLRARRRAGEGVNGREESFPKSLTY